MREGKPVKEILTKVIENRSLTKLTLSKSTDREILRTTGRLTQIKGQLFVTLERFYTAARPGMRTFRPSVPRRCWRP